MSLLVNLPDVILKYLQSFLSFDDIRSFINSNRRHFTFLKQETIYFSLNKEKSREYVEDERFREIILGKVKDGRKQIGLSFDGNYEVPDIRDIIAHKIVFGRIYPHFPDRVSSLVFILSNEVTEIPFLPLLQDLKLYNCSHIRDFSSLSHLKKLELSRATRLTDITPLQYIPSLRFVDCANIRNFSILSSKRQQFVSIRQSTISNVSSLLNIQTVHLSFCHQITDVSPLYGIKTLFLTHCYSIRDISCLGNHYRLLIFSCRFIGRGYECFRSVRHAEIIGCEVPDLSVFREVKSLQISLSKSMEKQLFLLKDIPQLILLSPSEYKQKWAMIYLN